MVIITVDLHKDVTAPASHGCEDSRTEVPCWVDSITTVEAKGEAYPPEKEANHEWLETSLHFRVLGVTDSKYPQHQQEGAKNLYCDSYVIIAIATLQSL